MADEVGLCIGKCMFGMKLKMAKVWGRICKREIKIIYFPYTKGNSSTKITESMTMATEKKDNEDILTKNHYKQRKYGQMDKMITEFLRDALESTKTHLLCEHPTTRFSCWRSELYRTETRNKIRSNENANIWNN